MTFTGPIFVRLRERMLESFPEGCVARKSERANLGDWIRSGSGAFVVTSVSAKEIVIQTSPLEIGSVFLRDVEYFIDQCIEHLAELHCFATDERFRSDAWNVVTAYYYSFYSAQFFMRLIGEASLYFDKKTVADLVALAGGGGGSPGAGVFFFQKRADISATQSEYVFSKQNRRPHEAVWKQVLKTMFDYSNDKALATDADECVFFGAIGSTKLFKSYLDYDWPSKVRYRTNYNPGFAYLLSRTNQVAKSKRLIERWETVADKDLSTVISASCSNVGDTLRVEDFASHVQLMHDVANGIFTLGRRLYLDLKSRRKLDGRWENDRRRFLNANGLPLYPFLSI